MQNNKLKGKIREKAKTYADCAEVLKISVPNFSDKINGKVDFRLLEAEQLGNYLEMTGAEKVDIFFT
jgi:hypothetical protein